VNHQWTCIVVVALAAACANAPDLKPGRSKDSNVACYQGTVRVTMPPDGRVVAEYPALVKRVYVPEKHQILEDSVVLAPDGTHHDQTTFWLDGKTANVTEASGAYSGDAVLMGEEGRWVSWTIRTQMAVQGKLFTVESYVALTPDGMTATRKVIGDDGVLGPTIREGYVEVDAAAFEALHMKALRKE